MHVRNKETAEIETMRHGAAVDAVNAGTHVFVNVDSEGEAKPEPKKSSTSTKAR